jgi:HrpA-like RNA helicase
MYSQEDHDEQFEEFTKPEMQRAPLQELVLQARNSYWNCALQAAF